MEAPKEIYVEIRHPISREYTEIIAFETPDKDSVKYIRADLAELTWEDIEKIVDLYEDVYSDYSCNGNGGITNTVEHYQEVLRRFLESKTQQGCSPD